LIFSDVAAVSTVVRSSQLAPTVTPVAVAAPNLRKSRRDKLMMALRDDGGVVGRRAPA